MIAIGLFFYRLDYYVTVPGTAETIDKNMLKVEHGYENEGSYNLVTVYVDRKRANIYRYLWAKYDQNPYTKLLKTQYIKGPDENEREREINRLDYMATAQEKAIYVAFKKAGLQPELEHIGLHLLNIMSEMPASNVLKPGDIVTKVSGKKIKTFTDLKNSIKDTNYGDVINMTVLRNDKMKQVEVPIGRMPKKYNEEQPPGLGVISPRPKIKVTIDKEVTFNTEDIGGPSAGLMMTLALYEQLDEQDLSNGRKICGTGTIGLDGKVGPIGGIKQKVVASDKSNCDIFFAPTAHSEDVAARAAGKDIGTKMKIVPVTNFNEAVRYLKKS